MGTISGNTQSSAFGASIMGSPTAIGAGGQDCCPPPSCDFDVAVTKPVITQCATGQYCNDGPYAADYCSPLGRPGTIVLAVGEGYPTGCQGSTLVSSGIDPPIGPSPFGCDYYPASAIYECTYLVTGTCAKNAKFSIEIKLTILQRKIPPDTFQNYTIAYRWFAAFDEPPTPGTSFSVPYAGNTYSCSSPPPKRVECLVATDPLDFEFV